MPTQLLRIVLLLLMAVPSVIAYANEKSGTENDTEVDLTPKIHGALRTRWEMDTQGGESRFQVRNARVNIAGMIAPAIDYYMQTDLCDCGKMKILDAWGRIALSPSVKFQAGQFRLPFGTDCFHGPANYLFANRSFIGKTVSNIRGVGAKLSYSLALGENSSLTIDGGAFNPTSMADHNVWVKKMAYAGKAVCSVGNISIAAGAETLIPEAVRINLLGTSVTWENGPWTIEGEYINKHYVNSAFKTSHSYNLFADYGFPVRLGVFNRASVQCRFDGMTSHSSGKAGEDGKLFADNAARNRATFGGTLTYSYKIVHCDIRLNYEKYFYHEGYEIPVGDGDKICAELVIKF